MHSISGSLKYLAICSLLIIGQASAIAQEDPLPEESATSIPEDKFNRGTPRGTADGFLAACDEGDFEKAAEYLDLRNLRGSASELSGVQLARRLFVIIKRGEWTDVGNFVHEPDGQSGDGLPDYRDSIGFVKDEGKEVELFLQKVPRGDGTSIWKISNATVSLIPDLYETYGYAEPIENLRRSLPQKSFLGFELFKWVIVLGVGLATYLLIFLIALLLRAAIADPNSFYRQRVFKFLIVPVALWVAILAINLAADMLGRGQTSETIGQMSPIPILLTVWVLLAGVSLIRDTWSARLLEQGRPTGILLMRPAINAFKLLIMISAGLMYLDNIGIDITTLLAGLGVGGVAAALALQKPIEDVFGAVTLYTQQPIRIGDFCRVGNVTGTIEEIGLRTTRLRTLDNTVVALPNAKLANEPIDNFSAREKIRYRPILRLRYDTTPEQLENVLTGIRQLLESQEFVIQEDHRVRFFEFGDDALKIEVNAYLGTTIWAEYLEMAEKLNIRIIDIVKNAGTSLALPSQILHLENPAGNLSN